MKKQINHNFDNFWYKYQLLTLKIQNFDVKSQKKHHNFVKNGLDWCNRVKKKTIGLVRSDNKQGGNEINEYLGG